MHELDAGQRTLGRVKRFETEHRTGDPLHSAMILFDDVIQIFHLADDDCRAMLRIVAPDRRGIGLAAIDRNRGKTRLAAIRCKKIPLHRTGNDCMAASYSAETSASARSRYRAKLFSSAWPLRSCSLGLMMPFLVKNVMI